MKQPPLRLYCIYSAEAVKAMKGNRGKLAAMAGHAFLHSWWDSFFRHPLKAIAYKFSEKAYKVALVVDTEDDLRKLEEHFRRQCGVSLVKDAGITVFERPTVACLGIGPIRAGRLEGPVEMKIFT